MDIVPLHFLLCARQLLQPQEAESLRFSTDACGLLQEVSWTLRSIEETFKNPFFVQTEANHLIGGRETTLNLQCDRTRLDEKTMLNLQCDRPRFDVWKQKSVYHFRDVL